MNTSKTSFSSSLNAYFKRWDFKLILLVLIDVLSILIVFQCVFYLNSPMEGGFFFSQKPLLQLFLLILPFWIYVLYLIKLTRIPTKRYKVLFFLYLHSSFIIFSILILYDFVFKFSRIPNLFMLELSVFGFFLLLLVRIILPLAFKNFSVRRHIQKNIVIIGDSSSLPFIESIFSKKLMGYNIDVIFTDSDRVKGQTEGSTIVLPEKYLGILDDLIEVDLIDEVFYLKENPDPEKVREILVACQSWGVTLLLNYKESEFRLTSAIRKNLADGKYLSFINISNKSYALAIRKTLDINLALIAIVVLSPVFIIISILIRITSPGPVIKKVEFGRGWGRQVRLYKFRTNIADAEEAWNPRELNNDLNKIESLINKTSGKTKLGVFLTNSGIDRLPMLFNILKGEISIIGPTHPLQSKLVKPPEKQV
jgi:lipopolysaccharide/colanic/teichoic acid biosynthesis glycosyltransferase